MKAHLRMCTCLLELKWVEEAQFALRKFQLKFPEHAGALACLKIYKVLLYFFRIIWASNKKQCYRQAFFRHFGKNSICVKCKKLNFLQKID